MKHFISCCAVGSRGTARPLIGPRRESPEALESSVIGPTAKTFLCNDLQIKTMRDVMRDSHFQQVSSISMWISNGARLQVMGIQQFHHNFKGFISLGLADAHSLLACMVMILT